MGKLGELTKSQQIKIYKYYIKNFKLPGKFPSVLPGREDADPSFVVFKSKYAENKILWRDLAITHKGTDAISLIQEMENLSRPQAYKFFRKKIDPVVSDDIEYTPKKSTPKLLIKNYFDVWDAAYWAKRYQTIETLNAENIYAGLELSWDGFVSDMSTQEDPMFFYKFKEDFSSWKMYRPLFKDGNPGSKWKSWETDDVIEGYNTLPDSYDSLIIAASTKDRLAWKLAHPAVINPTGEGVIRIILKHFLELSQRFSNIYCIFDADKKGVENSLNLSEMSGNKITHINAMDFTPFWLKDIDDIVVEQGPDAPGKILKNLGIL